MICKSASFGNDPTRLLKFVPLLLALLLAGCASDQTNADVNPPAAPVKPSVAPTDSANMNASRDRTYTLDANRTLPALFIVGDSTVHNTARGIVGWGDDVVGYFDTNKIIVQNRALGGRSSRTFITQGWWDKVLAVARPGDFVIIQLGHNDGGPIDDTNRARGSLRGIGNEETNIFNPVMQKPETGHTYGWYLRKYISDARARGMTPVLCSPVPHVPKAEVQAGDIENWDCVRFAGQVATNENVPFINLNKITMSHYAGMTPAEVKTNYFTPADNTHSSPAGAALNAQSVVEGLRALDCPLKDNLKLEQP